MTHDRTDVYTRITAEIVAAIEAGAGEFRMPWHHNGTLADLGIAHHPRPDHAAYVASWLRVLKDHAA